MIINWLKQENFVKYNIDIANPSRIFFYSSNKKVAKSNYWRALSYVFNRASFLFYQSMSFLYSYLIRPCMEMCKTIFKKRSSNLRSLVFLQIFIYALYWFGLNENSTQYLYMLKVFDGFDGAGFAHYQITMRIFGKLLNILIISNLMY